MRIVGLSAIAVLFGSIACGSPPEAQTREFVTELALTQVEADLGAGAVVVRPIDASNLSLVGVGGADDDDVEDKPCTVNGVVFSNCRIEPEQPQELHVKTTLCELKPDEPTRARLFVECRPPAVDVVRPVSIPHCPGHG